jgi:hypothetical protein
MTNHENPSPDGLFVKVGKVQIGAQGRLAVILTVALIAAYLARAWGWW